MNRRDEITAPAGRREAAAYVAEMSGELAGIARRHGLDTLGYLLDMARLEAENAVAPGGDAPSLSLK